MSDTTGTTHISFGILASIIQFKLTGHSDPGMVIVGALLPDIDSAESIISKCCPVVSKPISLIQKATKFLDHRHLTHSLIPLIILWILYNRFDDMIYMNLLVGWGSHLGADILNDRGIPVFFPFSHWGLKLAQITTGKRSEEILNLVVWLAIIGMIIPVEYWKMVQGETTRIVMEMNGGMK